MGKGSTQRKTNAQAFGANYDAIFGRKANPYIERAQLLAERNAMPDVTIAANMHKSEQICSTPFCDCPPGLEGVGVCAKGLPWDSEASHG